MEEGEAWGQPSDSKREEPREQIAFCYPKNAMSDILHDTPMDMKPGEMRRNAHNKCR